MKAMFQVFALALLAAVCYGDSLRETSREYEHASRELKMVKHTNADIRSFLDPTSNGGVPLEAEVVDPYDNNVNYYHDADIAHKIGAANTLRASYAEQSYLAALAEGKISELEGQLSTLTQALATDTTAMKSLEAGAKAGAAELKQVGSQMSSKTKQLNKAAAKETKLQAQINKASNDPAKSAKLQGQMETLTAQKQQIQSDIQTLEDRKSMSMSSNSEYLSAKEKVDVAKSAQVETAKQLAQTKSMLTQLESESKKTSADLTKADKVVQKASEKLEKDHHVGNGSVAGNGSGSGSSSGSGSGNVDLSHLTTGLIRYYSFNGDANDAIAGVHATVTGPVLGLNRFGSANSAYFFDGTDDTMKADASNLPTGERTVAVWAKFSSPLGNRVLFGYGGTNCGRSLFLLVNPGIVVAGAHCGINDVSEPISGVSESWVHWAFTTEVGISRLYMNGVLIKTSPIFISDTFVSGKKLVIGASITSDGNGVYTDASGGYMSGLLDDFRVYNRALSTSEITQLYNLKV